MKIITAASESSAMFHMLAKRSCVENDLTLWLEVKQNASVKERQAATVPVYQPPLFLHGLLFHIITCSWQVNSVLQKIKLVMKIPLQDKNNYV